MYPTTLVRHPKIVRMMTEIEKELKVIAILRNSEGERRVLYSCAIAREGELTQ